MKIKGDLKKQNKSSTELGKHVPEKKNEPPKGIKNIKAMIEATIKQQQRVKSLGANKKNK